LIFGLLLSFFSLHPLACAGVFFQHVAALVLEDGLEAPAALRISSSFSPTRAAGSKTSDKRAVNGDKICHFFSDVAKPPFFSWQASM
jgi:hypothetical protein